MIGEILLSRYKITQALGSGGFSDTYLAHDLALPGHPHCVVKHLRPKDKQDGILSIAQKLFEREAAALYKLGRHELIPSLYAHFEENQEFFLVQEYIQGHDIAEELADQQPLSEPDILKLLIAILGPLTLLHQEHCIHRDIKPHNIRRRAEDGKVVLIDFGAIKEIQSLTLLPSGETSRTITVGSPGYMPSEQIAGRPRLASDIYAVGMIGIQALTGRAPGQFEEDPMTGELLWQHEANVSPALGAVLSKMVHPYHLNRYPNAQEALNVVQTLLEKQRETTTSQPQEVTQVTRPQVALRKQPFILPRRLLFVGGVLAITLAIGALYHPITPWLQSKYIQAANTKPLSPITAVENYYQGINERRLGTTWKQLTPDKQQRGGGFRNYLEWWNTVDAVHIKEIELASESASQALVRVDLWYGMKDGRANRESKNLITLYWDSNLQSWLIDRVE